jgi:ferredoxin
MFVCNCCSCCCGFLRGLKEFGAPHLLVRSDWVAVIDAELCAACGECADRCPTQAISFDDRVMALQVVPDRCIGCGVCTVSCPGGGITMRERPAASATRRRTVSWAWRRSVSRSGTHSVLLRPLARAGNGARRRKNVAVVRAVVPAAAPQLDGSAAVRPTAQGSAGST